MKIFTLAVMMLALIAMPAHAQMGGKRHSGDDKKTDQKKPKEKYDPWGVARPAEPAKKTR
jgi:hypothetical protein